MEITDYRTGFWIKDGVFDGEPYEMRVMSLCMLCRHYREREGFAPVCAAFPKGIPPEIWLEKVSHQKPYEGDNGIQFEPKSE